MQKHIFTILFILITALSVKSQTFCRYQNGRTISYAKVEGDTLYPLTAAPWEGGEMTGNRVLQDSVRLLHPSTPRVILGLSGAYEESWSGRTPFKTVRWFLKPPGSAASPGDPVVLPASLDEVLVETELVIVIGKRIKNGDPQTAAKAIFGYTAGNDIVGSVPSYHRLQGESEDQEETLLGPGLKIGDGFAVFGPYIHRGIDWRHRTRRLDVIDGQSGEKSTYTHSTSGLLYSPAKIVSDLSRVLTLSPGDIIFTGTTKALPAQAGDVVTISVDGLGTCTNRIVSDVESIP
ncbi:DUF2437 domain-containing protein [candidate division KSB1 bacterium]|nr:DUF2437 domain-containing protein [candidate division KSB1 bacterium]